MVNTGTGEDNIGAAQESINVLLEVVAGEGVNLRRVNNERVAKGTIEGSLVDELLKDNLGVSERGSKLLLNLLKNIADLPELVALVNNGIGKNLNGLLVVNTESINTKDNGVTAGLDVSVGTELLKLAGEAESRPVGGGLEGHKLKNLASTDSARGLSRGTTLNQKGNAGNRASRVKGSELNTRAQGRGLERGSNDRRGTGESRRVGKSLIKRNINTTASQTDEGKKAASGSSGRNAKTLAAGGNATNQGLKLILNRLAQHFYFDNYFTTC
mmetsp:Transcript_29471/g.54096  ORF Transcript_29471/g.54096 Transcript_29471/m.54096 type:complete len:271 (+) Transcript_29471:847-1659(+)